MGRGKIKNRMKFTTAAGAKFVFVPVYMTSKEKITPNSEKLSCVTSTDGTSCHQMFAVLTRPVQRRAVYHATRCLSQNVPPPPRPPSGSERASQQPSPDASENAPKLNLSELPNLDFVPAEIKEEPKKTGAKSAKDTLTTGEKQRRHVLRLTWAALLLGLGASAVYMGREWDEDELESKRMVRIIQTN